MHVFKTLGGFLHTCYIFCNAVKPPAVILSAAEPDELFNAAA
jgi:hypothetical protein